MGGGGHAGDHLQQADVLGVAAELVVADQHAVGLAAELAVLLLVDLLEQGALVELDGLLQVLEQLLLADVEDPDLQVLAGLASGAPGSAGRARSTSSFWKSGWCMTSLSWAESFLSISPIQ